MRCPRCDGATYAWDASGARRCTSCKTVWPAEYMGVKGREESVGPFPPEPAPGSPEAVEQAARVLQGFTPGPWEIRQHRDDPHPEPGIMAGKYYVATCHDMEEQTGPNADLIAAAPDLLAERDHLQAEVQTLRTLHDDACEQTHQLAAEVERLKAVLRTAEGNLAVVGEASELKGKRLGAFHSQLLAAGFSDPAPAQVGELAEQRDALADALAGARMIVSAHLCPFGVALLPVNDQAPGFRWCDCNYHDAARAIDKALRKAGR